MLARVSILTLRTADDEGKGDGARMAWRHRELHSSVGGDHRSRFVAGAPHGWCSWEWGRQRSKTKAGWARSGSVGNGRVTRGIIDLGALRRTTTSVLFVRVGFVCDPDIEPPTANFMGAAESTRGRMVPRILPPTGGRTTVEHLQLEQRNKSHADAFFVGNSSLSNHQPQPTSFVFGASEKRLQCSKCLKIFGKGSNLMSLKRHVEADKSQERVQEEVPSTTSVQPSAQSRVKGGPTSKAPSPSRHHVQVYVLIGTWTTSGTPILSKNTGTVRDADVISPCSRCSLAGLDFNILKERASRPFGRLHAEEDLNHVQLQDKLSVIKDDVNTLKLKTSPIISGQILNLTDSLASSHDPLSDFTYIFEFIGHNQIAALHRIFWNASKEGWGVKKLRKHIQLARDEIDLIILLYEPGGAGAVYAMNHSIFVIPSLKTIQPYLRQHKIVPSLATERRIDYIPATDEMGGFCHEHLKALDTVKVGKDIRNVEAAVAAVREGKVHIAQEASVGAISRLSRTGYGARPVFIGSTCKKETWRECLKTMLTVVEAWKQSPDGEAKYGPILDVASDGAGHRLLALLVMCMHSEILPGNPLYPFIRNLPGLNRRVGKDNLTEDFDYRHELKRSYSDSGFA
ncbi:hypothetical protein B0H19DRAFT_1345083 [Mycena capillaripes]|nr:hypothetical protein B0H19DRAFT_1345083 [Mycena capillaripes]